jgi:membrane-associated phospholipid phosphatase
MVAGAREGHWWRGMTVPDCLTPADGYSQRMPRRARIALIGAAFALALLFLTWYLAFHVGPVERADQSIFRGFSDLGSRSRIHSLADFIAALCDPSPWIYFAAAVVALPLLRRRVRVAFAVAAILLGANVTTQLLKPLLAEPRAASLFGGHAPVNAASWPSGHATAAMSLALCLILAVPSRLRPWAAALGAGFAVAVSYSFLTLGWHYPSDVFGGFLVASAWTLVGIGTVLTLDARRPPRIPSEHGARLSAIPAARSARHQRHPRRAPEPPH